MTEAVFVYITAGSEAEARSLGRALVEERLAACANIIPGMISIYRWEKKMEEAQEAVLIVKTRAALFPALEARVKALHSYDTPCIAALPVAAAHQPYLDWILSATES
jgi:periplasmic divalent cation tolerance protein